MNYEDQRKHALKVFRGEKYKELRKAIKEGLCFEELFKIAKECGVIEKIDYFLSEWAYWWTRVFPEDKELMRDRVIESEWAYVWVREFPEDKELMRDRVTESEWAYYWVIYFPEDRELMRDRVTEYRWACYWVRDFPEDKELMRDRFVD